jgi:translation initiation factor 1
MSAQKRRTVYSTDPEPEKEQPGEKAPAPRNPAAPYAIQGNNPVRVHKERQGRGGKTVSVVKGVLSPKPGKEALLKLLKSKLGTGGALRGDNLEIQGDQRERIVAILNELGYRAKSAGG